MLTVSIHSGMNRSPFYTLSANIRENIFWTYSSNKIHDQAVDGCTVQCRWVHISVLFLWIFRLLLALVLVPSPCWPPPLTCAVSILSNARADRNLKVTALGEREKNAVGRFG